MSKIQVLLVDDHALFREGLSKIIKSQPDFEVVGEANDGIEAMIKASELLPDLILMDVTMPVCDGLEATQRIKANLPDVIIVMLTVSDEDGKVFEAIRNGAQGYLLKSINSNEMLASLRGAVRGEAAISRALGGRMLEEFRRISQRSASASISSEELVSLTIREQEVLKLVAEGKTNKEIGTILNVSINTVKSHMRKILSKLHLSKRQEAALYAKQEGLISPSRNTSTE
jgi:two-component system NarL family response regulator